MIQPNTVESYRELAFKLDKLDSFERHELCRWLARTDLFFLLWFVCNGGKFMEKQWLLDRCKEVQNEPDGHLDLWAREHLKSTIITFGKTLQDILASHGDDPLQIWNGVQPTFGIFSHTRGMAKGFLRQLMRTLEGNTLLRALFPDIIWEKCQTQAPKWSENEGIILKRTKNPKECTVEAWGLVDGQPTGKHFTVCVYDDVVTDENTKTTEMIEKTTNAWEMSLNLSTQGGKQRYIGTRYHFNDTYRVMMSRGVVLPRIHTATDDGTTTGNPVLFSREELSKRRRSMSAANFSSQYLQNPIADSTENFKKDWLRFHSGIQYLTGNKYILVDPASEKKKSSDYTAIVILDLGEDNNYKLADAIRDRLNLKERVDELFRLHRKWRPLTVFYEQYGMQADISYIKERQARENYYFNIVALHSKTSKKDRIGRLIPVFEQSRFYLPDSLFKTNYEGKVQDLVDIFINEEYLSFPIPVHDDMLDAIAWIDAPEIRDNIIWPSGEDNDRNERYRPKRSKGSTWAV